ncbi:ABC transporter substrate-binding protein [Streptomyces sp. 71268]|uniref:caspase, EACC1-associated type n=1 Tax=Streptomyces sp. 71268 TaxID=3002640 RepID=UPI0023F7DC1A|nr:ABC transporter substrate-binding protein [Streptomyces sp. 71268]WEV25813.1 ABC transporter substrate-binding protein [Streptomyces sp. 71268]
MPDPAVSRAVLIGTTGNAEIAPLPAVAANLVALADVLTSDRSWDLAREHCAVLAEPVTSDAVAAVRTAAAEATDVLLVYVAGRCRIDPASGELVFAPAAPAPGRSATGLDYATLRQAVLSGRARRRVVLLDCCLTEPVPGSPSDPAAGSASGSASTTAPSDARGGAVAVADAAQLADGYVLAAATGDLDAYASEEDQHTSFTGELLRMAADGMAYGPEALRLDMVYEHSRASLAGRERALPERRDLSGAAEAGRVAFVRNAASTGAAPFGATTLLRAMPPAAPPASTPTVTLGTAGDPAGPEAGPDARPVPDTAAASPVDAVPEDAPPPADAVPRDAPPADAPPSTNPAAPSAAPAQPGAFGAPPPAFGAAPPPFDATSPPSFGAAPGQQPAAHPGQPPAAPAGPAGPHAAPPPPAQPGAQPGPQPGPQPGAQPAPYGAPPAPYPGSLPAPPPPFGPQSGAPGAPPAQAAPSAVGAGAGFAPPPRADGTDGPWWRQRRVRYGALAVALAVVAGAVITVVWPEDKGSKDAPTDRPKASQSASGNPGAEGDKPGGGPGVAAYDAATKGVVNPSKRQGGTLKFVSTMDADSWDPQRGYYGFTWNFSRFYARQLLTYATEPGAGPARLVPDLATGRARVGDGGKTYTYTLRPGATWEDGTPVTSKDVKYGIERTWAADVISGGPSYLREVLDPKSDYPGPYKDKAKDKLGLRAIQTPNDRTITFKLPRPYRDFEHLLAMPSASPVPRAKDTRATYAQRPFSSGPYKFDAYQPGKSLTLVRNERWQRSSDPVRTALPDRISVDIVVSPTTRDQELRAGRYDLDISAFGVDASQRVRLLDDAKTKAQVDNPHTGIVRYAALASNVAPFNDVHCRRAVFYATDKRSVRAATGDPRVGDELAPHLLPPGVSGSEPDYDPYGTKRSGGAPDLERARQELKECGKPTGFRTTVAVSDGPQEVAVAEAIKASLARVGISVKVEQLPFAEFATAIGKPDQVKRKGYGISLRRWSADYPTGRGMLEPLADGRRITPQGNLNVALLRDKALDKLFDTSRANQDQGRAESDDQRINHKVSDAAAYLPLTFEKALTWRNPRLTNVTTTSAYGGGYDFVSLGVLR